MPARRWARRWIAAAFRVLLAIVAVLVVGGSLTEQVLRNRARHRFPARGTLVDVDGRRLQIDCRGSGSPTVILEAGLDHVGSLSWAAVHDSIARTTRVCAYSRAGILWSDRSADGFDAGRAARTLRLALARAGERPPFVMVGHSLGGPYVVTFTTLHRTEVAGVVLVDASHPDQQTRLAAATGLPLARMQPPLRLMTLGAALSWTGALRLSGLDALPGSWPAVSQVIPAAFFTTAVRALRDEVASLGETLARVRLAHDLGAQPLVVLTAGARPSDEELAAAAMTRAQQAGKHREWLALQREMTGWSSDGRHEVVADASHYIQFDRPDVVIRAVVGVVQRARDGARNRLR